MQLYLTVALYVLATVALTEAKPMYCNECQYGGGGGGGGGGQYGNRQERYRSEYGYERQSRVSVDQYSGGGNSNGGYGGGGQYGGGQYSSGGHGSSGYGVSEYGGGRGFSGGRSNAYVPSNCSHCNVKTFGNGDHNSNTFNLPKEAYL